MKMLQWGHGLSAMETGEDVTWDSTIVTLQWGHGLSAMETFQLTQR